MASANTVTDFGQYTALRASAERDDPQALKAAAQQFEALFVQSLLKNMRGAQLAEPMFGSDQMEMYQEMFDQQISVEMASGRGIGFADVLVRQLGGEPGSVPTSSAGGAFGLAPMRPAGAVGSVPEPAWDSPREFVADVWPHAERAASRLGVRPEALVAQAALETGWGAHVPRATDGSGYNLFGIKAGSGWAGASVSRGTLEFSGGVAERRVEHFRAYRDVGASFDDYAELIGGNPRYAAALGKGDDVAGFAAALQSAGYATDPDYASKINEVVNSRPMREALTALKDPAGRPIDKASAFTATD